MKYLVNLDLRKNQIINAAAQNLAVLPTEGLVPGWFIYYTGIGEQGAGFYVCNGSSWEKVGETIDSLQDIGDVLITDPVAGEILRWTGTTWVNSTLAEAGIQPAGAVTSVSGSAPVSSTGGTTPTISLASGYGDAQNPYASKTAKHVLAAPNAADGVPGFRALVASDIPLLNQDTTGEAGSVANAITFTGGNTGVFDGSAPLTVAAPYAWAQAATKPSYVPFEVGLGNVTNDAQVKKIASSSAGNIPTWADTNGNLLATGYSVESTLVGGTGAIPRADAVKNYVDGLIAASDAMVFKGTVGTGGTYTIAAFNALTVYNAGWTYKVIEAGLIKGRQCEIGDMLVATVDRTSGGTNADWVVLQTNVDGAVTGPVSSVNGNFASFNGTSGKIIADSGYSFASFEPVIPVKGTAFNKDFGITAGTVLEGSFVEGYNIEVDNLWQAIADEESARITADTDIYTWAGQTFVTFGQYDSEVSAKTDKYAITLATSALSYVITHNLDTTDVVVSIREVSPPNELVYATVEITSVNTITVRFAVAPAAGEYRVVVIG